MQEPARDGVEVMVSGVNGNVLSERRRTASVMTKRGRIPSTGDEKTKLLRRLQGTTHFEKTLSTSNVSHHGKSALVCASGRVQNMFACEAESFSVLYSLDVTSKTMRLELFSCEN